jgi:carboxylesterase
MGSNAAIDPISGVRPHGRLVGSGDPTARSLDGSAPRVLALHGFAGTPREMELVLEAAAAAGLGGAAPLLPGHGTAAAELATSNWSAWYGAAEAALLELTRDQTAAVVVGLSLGSLLASHLAAFHPRKVAGLGLLANACWLARPTDLVLRAVSTLRLPDWFVPKFGSDIANDAARRDHLTYDVQPWHAALHVRQAGVRTRVLLPRVRVPVFIAHGARDRVCPPANATRVARLLPPPRPNPLLLPRSRHVVTRDLDRVELRERLVEFFSRLPLAGIPRPPERSPGRTPQPVEP